MAILLDVNQVNDICDYWNRSITNFDSNIPVTTKTSSNGFKMLEEAGFDLTSISKYNSNVDELSSYLNDYYQAVKKHVELMNEDDTYLYDNIPKKDIEDLFRETRASAITVEDSTKSSDMSNLADERANLNKNKVGESATYDSSYAGNNTVNLVNINHGTEGTVTEVDDEYSKIIKQELTEADNGNGTTEQELNMSVPAAQATLSNISNSNNQQVQNAEDVANGIKKTTLYELFNMGDLNSNLKVNNVNNPVFDNDFNSNLPK